MTKDKAKTLLDNLIGMVEDNQASDYDEALRMAIAELEQEPCDTISRDAVLKRIAQFSTEEGSSVECQPLYSDVYNMPSVQPSRKWHWIYDETLENWRCSKYNETPKTMGYVGTADFMAEHFKFCNHCGADMRLITKGELYEGEFEDGDTDAT